MSSKWRELWGEGRSIKDIYQSVGQQWLIFLLVRRQTALELVLHVSHSWAPMPGGSRNPRKLWDNPLEAEVKKAGVLCQCCDHLLVLNPRRTIYLFIYLLFFNLFRAASTAYGGSHARGLVGAVAAGLHHGSQQCWILNPLSEARDRTCNLMVPSRIHSHCTTMGTPGEQFIKLTSWDFCHAGTSSGCVFGTKHSHLGRPSWLTHLSYMSCLDP